MIKIAKLRELIGGGRLPMARLCGEILEGIERPLPSDPDSLFEALRVHVEQRLAEMEATNGMPVRPLHLLFREFPEGTASGLSLELEDKWVIVVERNTSPIHQLVILAHEVWHVLNGHCSQHSSHPANVNAAARSLGGSLGEPEIQALAARAHVIDRKEDEAEAFGLLMGHAFRGYLEPGTGLAPQGSIAGRIQASLGIRSS
ncbi:MULTISPECIES: ImmA/IrrE family metallo-endopeptidase [unclassified Streptomyces]|uniref:ImmA/IrrE family metallo-endopeptidase n=1 Tax=unclassified Streptomyces TaxID=2593676 RepID=UPI00131B6333|nr:MULTISPECIES: toxin-antitoxin system, toxin component [unclassified Streptomyces]